MRESFHGRQNIGAHRRRCQRLFVTTRICGDYWLDCGANAVHDRTQVR